MAIIDCRNVIKIHKQGNLEVVALQGLDFVMEEGEFVSVVGKSGAGKSTLLRILAGLEKPSAGKVFVAGVNLTDASGAVLTNHYRRDVGFLWQDYTRNLLPYLSVMQNIELPMLLSGVGRRKRRARAKALLEATGLENHAFNRLNRMSGGEQQRLAMCVALAMGPKLLLADEPTGELDTETSLEVYELLRRMAHEAGLSILVVTHDVAVASRSDRVIRLADGQVASATAVHHEILQVGSDGSLALPSDLRIEAGIGEHVRAEVTEDGILLRPERDLNHHSEVPDVD